MDGGGASILRWETLSTKEKSPCQTVNIKNESLCQVRDCRKLSPCQFESSKTKYAAKGLNSFHIMLALTSCFQDIKISNLLP